MAQKVHIVLEDDIDGSEASETITFALDGTTYEIDLSDDNAEKLRNAFAPYIGHARKTSGRAAGNRASRRQAGASAADVRAWAKSNGYSVPERGRIPGDVRSAYDAAN
jgi:hypothetical protein